MRLRNLHTKMVFAFATMLVAMAGCTDDLGPQRDISKPHLSDIVTGDETSLSVVDDYGIQYTLDLNSQQISASNGQSVSLDSSTTVEARELFSQMIESDSTDQEVAALGGCINGRQGCFQDVAVTGDRQTFSESLNLNAGVVRHKIIWNINFTHAKKKSIGSDRSATGQSRMNMMTPSSIAGPRFDLGGDPCSDIVTNAAQLHEDYRSSRQGILDVLLTSIGSAGTALGLWEQQKSSFSYSATATNVTAWVWNSHSCSSRIIYAGPVFVGQTVHGTKTCYWETALITFDGGHTYHDALVEVCYLG